MLQKGGSSSVQSSLVSNDQTEVFDIGTEEGILSLLYRLHRTTLGPDTKNNLRDFLFLYIKNKNKETLAEVTMAFGENGFSIQKKDSSSVVKKDVVKKDQSSDISRIGHHRSSPVFVQTKLKNITETVSPDVQSESAVQTEIPTSSDESIKISKKTDDVGSVPPEANVQVKVTVDTNFSERIKEIKKLVNEKIGNPISLIDADETLGREYMNSLLSAMKSVNGGKEGEVETAMERLENAYMQVKNLDMSKKETSSEVKEGVQKSKELESHNTVVPKSQTDESTKVSEPVKAELQASTPTPISPPVPTPKIPTVPEKSKAPAVPPVMPNAIPLAPNTEIKNPTEASVPVVPENNMSVEKKEINEDGQSGLITSVAKEKQLQDLMQNNRVQQVQDAKDKEKIDRASMDPLQLPEVSDGLHQLLSEWNLFKSSGIFGTGPNGNDHPLYKKLETLTMAAVIAGRFEGATSEIKQSITDYMNGWRYEEGVVHVHEETFEHYLRRVIKHILDKKERKTESKDA